MKFHIPCGAYENVIFLHTEIAGFIVIKQKAPGPGRFQCQLCNRGQRALETASSDGKQRSQLKAVTGSL